MATEIVLGFIALFTSAIAGVIGFGGGMLLIAVLPSFVSPGLIIPIHGITQLASNSSRMAFSLRQVRWDLLPKFLLGSIVGTLLFGYLLFHISTDYVPIAIGLYILLNIWHKRFAAMMARYENFYVIGLLQTGLGLIVGATGPLSLTALAKKLSSHEQIIATSSMFMTISHLAKLPVYFTLSQGLFDNIALLGFMIAGSIAGSFIGTQIRVKANNDKLMWLMKVLLSGLAIHMLIRTLLTL